MQLSSIDCSGSMSGNRIRLARLAVLKALKLLGPEDSAALTTFSHNGNTIRPLTQVDEAGSMALRNGLQHTMPDGATNLFEGWELAAKALSTIATASRVSFCCRTVAPTEV
ncbi:MAG: VWA domain-containing protein [bacterium]